MNAGNEYPKTLVDAVRYFSDPQTSQDFFVSIRWPDGVTCPHCGSKDVSYLANQRRWQCKTKHPRRQFSAKVGTIFEDSPLSIEQWMVGIWLEANAKNSISSYEVHRALGITQKTAWFLLHRIRTALAQGSFDKMSGEVESDESFFGGKAKNMHAHKRKQLPYVRGFGGKAIIHGLIERGNKKEKRISRVRAKVVADTKAKTLVPLIVSSVEKGSNVYTDCLQSYKDLHLEEFIHQTIDHAEKYVDGRIHTNSLENFWSLFKRCINGTHISVEPFHLVRYLDSECFRFNNRTDNDGQRFVKTLQGVTGKRITYQELTGKAPEAHKSSDNDGVGASDPPPN